MRTPIEKMIYDAVSCIKCGTKGMLKCACFYQCFCGWYAGKDKKCRNNKCKGMPKKLRYNPYFLTPAK